MTKTWCGRDHGKGAIGYFLNSTSIQRFSASTLWRRPRKPLTSSAAGAVAPPRITVTDYGDSALTPPPPADAGPQPPRVAEEF